MATFSQRTRYPVSAEELYRWHLRPGAYERYNPPWDSARVVRRSGPLGEGAEAELQVKVGPFRRTMIAVHHDFIEGRQFRDVQTVGPFARWEHTHLFEPAGEGAAFLEDRIEYELPLGPVGSLLQGSAVRRRLARIFAYRHRVLMQDMLLDRSGPTQRILISGAHGLVGSALVPFLTTAGHDVSRLVRYKVGANPAEIFWDPRAGKLETAAVERFDAVVHLAGENIAAGRWTERRKKAIRESRVQSTRLLCETLAKATVRPKLLISASAVGFYGDRGAEVMDETSSAGSGFLADVCKEWESATEPARASGIRVVNLRFGVILTPAGGALAKMLTPFKMGVGGKIGSGKQYMSWIALDDVLGVMHHVMSTESLSGPVNAVALEAVTNYDFTKTLGSVIKRPTVMPMPAFAAKLAFGQMADEALLASNRAKPAALAKTGYRFFYPDLRMALSHVLGKIEDNTEVFASFERPR